MMCRPSPAQIRKGSKEFSLVLAHHNLVFARKRKLPAYDLLASLRIWEQVHREGEGWEYFICASKTHTMPSMRTAIKSSPARRFAQAQTGPRLGGPNKAKKSLGPLGSASENVDVNMNVYVYVNVSADRPPGSNKARNCRDHLRYFRVSGSRRATVSREPYPNGQ